MQDIFTYIATFEVLTKQNMYWVLNYIYIFCSWCSWNGFATSTSPDLYSQHCTCSHFQTSAARFGSHVYIPNVHQWRNICGVPWCVHATNLQQQTWWTWNHALVLLGSRKRKKRLSWKLPSHSNSNSNSNNNNNNNHHTSKQNIKP